MTILFDGLAEGMLLFLISVGLSVTLGLMNFVNLAHGSFAMLGGYVGVVLLNRYGIPFLAALPIATLASALVGVEWAPVYAKMNLGGKSIVHYDIYGAARLGARPSSIPSR